MVHKILSFVFLLSFVSIFAEGKPVSNFAQVTEGVYRGGRPLLSPMDQVAWLHSLGVKTIIDLQGGDLNNPGLGWIISWTEPGEKPANIAREGHHAEALGMDFYNAPLNSLADVTADEGRRIDQVLDLMNEPSAQPVFVHCEHGIDRTGLVVALYRVKYQNWGIKAAHDEMVAMGHDAAHQVFTHDMDEYFFEKASEIVHEKSLAQK